MTKPPKLMVFSDLDGTLIDHETYRWDKARPALAALRAASCGLVLASSKTAAEIAVLRQDMGFEDWPAIVENGAGVLQCGAGDISDLAPYTEIRRCLDALPPNLRKAFRGFGDMTVQDVAQVTGLSPSAAALAKKRAFSEPGQWLGSKDEKTAFGAALSGDGITAQQGGRFLTLSFGANKADRMREMIKTYTPRHTVALGDAPNDVAMLTAADYGVVVSNPQGQPIPPLPGEERGRVLRTQKPGPAGWNEAVLSLLQSLNLQGTAPHV